VALGDHQGARRLNVVLMGRIKAHLFHIEVFGMGTAGTLVAEEQSLKCVTFIGADNVALAFEQHIEAKLLRHDLGKKIHAGGAAVDIFIPVGLQQAFQELRKNA